MASLLNSLNAGLAGVASAASRSLVHISNGRGHGAGTIWHPEGLIVTNAHVVGRARAVGVQTPNGDRYEGTVLVTDRDLDLAAVAVEAHALPTAVIGDSKALRPGDWVLASGHPFGVQNAATQGVVIGVGDKLPERPAFGTDWLAMSLHLRPGHSGGPVMDISGKLVGINTIMAGPEVGVAIPVHVVKAFLKRTIGSEANPRQRVA